LASGGNTPKKGARNAGQDEPRRLKEELPKGDASSTPELAFNAAEGRVEALAVPCTRPLGGYRTLGGEIKLRLASDDRWTGELAEVRCGQCPDCRIEKGRQWAVRCTHEAMLHDQNSFITLTYENEHLPPSGSVDVKEWQNFAKKLRKLVGPFRFLHVGEYGEENQRPHYHALIFGKDFSEDRKTISIDPNSGRRKYESAALAAAWGKGFHDLQDMAPENINYVCRYALKKVLGTSDQAEELRRKRYERYDSRSGETWMVRPEYTTMSRRPGIGSEWFKKYHSDLFPGDFVVLNGKRATIPNYYTKLLEQKDPELHAKIKAKRQKSTAGRVQDHTPERRLAREKITIGKMKNNERT